MLFETHAFKKTNLVVVTGYNVTQFFFFKLRNKK